MREILQKEKDDFLKQHLEYVKKIQEEFEAIKQLNQEKIQTLVQNYNDLYQAFEMRPSRAEDLDLILKLKNDNVEKTEELRKALENLKVFKLELFNREENYNKMFNAAPMIGVMNPLDRVSLSLWNDLIIK